MSNALAYFGVFLMAVAIIGGGLKAFGFEVGPLASIPRQVALFVFGLVLVLIDVGESIPRPWGDKEDLFVLNNIASGNYKAQKFDTAKGKIVATIMEITSSNPSKTLEPRVYLCSTGSSPSCVDNQVAEGGSIGLVSSGGEASVKVFNYIGNPTMGVTIRVRYSK